MRIAAFALTCLPILVALAGAVDVARAQTPFGPGLRGGGPFIRPMGPPFMRPFGRPFFRPFGPPGPLFGGPMRPGGRLFAPPPPGRECFTPAEARGMILARKLTEPFQALQKGALQGEALRARLCRWKSDEFVYEVAVLKRDGRLVRVYMNAQTGQSVDNPDRK